MKKFIALFLILIMAASLFVFTACENNQQSDGTDNTQTGSNDQDDTDSGDDDKDPEDGNDEEEPQLEYCNIICFDGSKLISTTAVLENTVLNSLFGTTIKEPTKQGYKFLGWYVNPELTTSVQQNFVVTDDVTIYAKFAEINSKYGFANGFSATSYLANTDTVTDSNGQTISKQTALDRQFDIFATNLLMGLSNIYGIKSTDYYLDGDDQFINSVDLQYNGQSYSYNGYNAKFDAKNILIDFNNITSEHICGRNESTSKSQDVDCLACYADYYSRNLSIYDAMINIVNNNNAINGGYVWNNINNRFATTLFNEDSAWNWNFDEGKAITDCAEFANGYIEKYKNKLKLQLAKIVAGSEFSNINNYSELLNVINHLGFSNNDKTELTDYVLNTIIGSGVVELDSTRKPEITKLTAVATYTPENHLYKAYSLIVPALVEKAFDATFESTDVSLYPHYEFKQLVNEDATFSADNGFSIYLQPKQISELGALIINSTVSGSVKVDAVFGNFKASNTFDLNVGNNFLNLNSSPIVNISSYNGMKEINYNLYENNMPYLDDSYNIDEAKLFGNSYIKLTFENMTDSADIEISGYLQKLYDPDQIIE